MADDALALVPFERIERQILALRGEKVLLDADLAELYGVPTKALVQAVKRNLARFPGDFMFRLTAEEAADLRSQSVTASRRNVSAPPYAFTELGVAMLSSVLRSERAVRVNIEIMRAFVRLRRALVSQEAIAERLEDLRGRVDVHDEQLAAVFRTFEQLFAPSPAAPKRIGFGTGEGGAQ